MASPFSRKARRQTSDRTPRGQPAEDLALAYLRARGLALIARNYRCPGGELDLVMRDASVMVFVEVRHRRRDRHGSAAESIDARKRARLVHAAMRYLQGQRDGARLRARFDVVALSGPLGTCEIEWIRNAFDA